MAFTLTDSRVTVDMEALWKTTNTFFESFGAEEWGRRHGRDWTFADVPYHLAYHNRLLADTIKRGAKSSEEDALSTLAELNAWNNEQQSRRPPGYTPEEALAEMRESQAVLRRAAREAASESAVWLPVLEVRGWRTTRFALAFNYWHTWLHLSEAHLRRHNTLPPLHAALMKRGLDFFMEITAKAINAEVARGENFIWTLTLTGAGGGVWTFGVKNGESRVIQGDSSRADMRLTTDIATYMKTAAFRMNSPLWALLTGQARVRGIGQLAKLRRLYAPPVRQVWQPLEQGSLIHE
ncbi:MAG: DinB family protein [Chloroflexi bacterium]|nr:DinB family protein [Chloroflexota bacterium]